MKRRLSTGILMLSLTPIVGIPGISCLASAQEKPHPVTTVILRCTENQIRFSDKVDQVLESPKPVDSSPEALERSLKAIDQLKTAGLPRVKNRLFLGCLDVVKATLMNDDIVNLLHSQEAPTTAPFISKFLNSTKNLDPSFSQETKDQEAAEMFSFFVKKKPKTEDSPSTTLSHRMFAAEVLCATASTDDVSLSLLATELERLARFHCFSSERGAIPGIGNDSNAYQDESSESSDEKNSQEDTELKESPTPNPPSNPGISFPGNQKRSYDL